MSDREVPILIYATFPSLEEARPVARKIIGQKYGACVNLLPEMISFYEWEGKLEEEREVVMLVKTTKAREEELVDFICAEHSYDEPAILALPVVGGSTGYLNWVVNSVGG